MRNFAISLGMVLLLASAAGAQSNQSSFSATSPSPSLSAVSQLPEFALNAPVAAAPETPAASASAALPSESLPSTPSPAGAPPQGVHGVYQNYSFQIYGGYTFMRFYEVPSITQTQNGFNIGGVYYYKSGFVGADGELLATFGSALGYHSRLSFAGGGPRFRWSGPRGLELWGHALVGGAHLTPRTAFGSQGAFGYVAGGGIDVNAHHRRIAYRAEADLLATRFFNTYQYSPQVSVGIVFKF
jgi:hypothetical protein